MIKVKEAMTSDPVITVPSDTVDHVAKLMKEGDSRQVIVVDSRKTKKLVGILTARDIAVRVVAEGGDPKLRWVEDVMTRNVVTCRPHHDLQDALTEMGKHNVRGVPVVDHLGTVLGIVEQAKVAPLAG